MRSLLQSANRNRRNSVSLPRRPAGQDLEAFHHNPVTSLQLGVGRQLQFKDREDGGPSPRHPSRVHGSAANEVDRVASP